MQIIAVGLHKNNVPEHLWKRGEESADIGREHLKRLHGANPEDEFLLSLIHISEPTRPY